MIKVCNECMESFYKNWKGLEKLSIENICRAILSGQSDDLLLKVGLLCLRIQEAFELEGLWINKQNSLKILSELWLYIVSSLSVKILCNFYQTFCNQHQTIKTCCNISERERETETQRQTETQTETEGESCVLLFVYFKGIT